MGIEDISLQNCEVRGKGMKRFWVILIVLMISTYFAQEFKELVVEVTLDGICGKEEVMEALERKALFEYIKNAWKEEGVPAEVIAKYVLKNRPLGYVKEVKLLEMKVEHGKTWGKGKVIISEGKVITGIKELIEDLGNPKVFVKVEGSDEAKEMVYSSLVRDMKNKGFEIVKNMERSDVVCDVDVKVDVEEEIDEYGKRYVVGVNLSLDLVDRKSSMVFATSEVSDRMNGVNVSFMVGLLVEELVKHLVEEAYPNIMEFLWSRYNKRYEMHLLGFTGKEVEDFKEFLEKELSLLLDLSDRGVKTENGVNIHVFEIYYMGKPTRLSSVLEEKYDTRFSGNIIEIEKRKIYIIVKKCSSDRIQEVFKMMRKLNVIYKLDSYKSETLRISVEVDNPIEFFTKFSDVLKLTILEMDENHCVYTF